MITNVPAQAQVFTLDNTALRGADKFDFCDKFLQNGVVSLSTAPVGDPSTFDFSTTAVLHDGFGAMTIEASACRIRRDPGKFQDLWSDTVIVNFVSAGKLLIEQDGRSTALGPGDGAICDATRPYALQLDNAFDGVIIKFSRRLLSAGIDFEKVTALSLASTSQMAGLLHNYASNLMQSAPRLDAGTTARLMRTFVDTLETTLAPVNRGADWRRGDYRKATLSRISQFVEARLQDPDLTPGRVAELLKLPPRYLHKLFAAEGTSVGRYIRDERLVRTAAALTDPKRSGASITEIAFQHGFKDLGHFSRLFRARFGVPPSDYRVEQARQGLERARA